MRKMRIFVFVIIILYSHCLIDAENIFSPNIIINHECTYKSTLRQRNSSLIQSAIDNASDGDIIHLESGIYFGNIIINKNLKKLFKEKLSEIGNLNLDFNKRPEELSNETYYKIALEYEKLFN